MVSRAKRFALLLLSALAAGAGALLAFLFIFLPREKMKIAESMAKTAAEKALALKAAADTIEKHTAAQTAKVDERIGAEKAHDSVDLANDIIAARKDKA